MTDTDRTDLQPCSSCDGDGGSSGKSSEFEICPHCEGDGVVQSPKPASSVPAYGPAIVRAMSTGGIADDDRIRGHIAPVGVGQGGHGQFSK